MSHLQHPVGAGHEAGEAEGEDVVRRELLHHLGVLHHAQLGEHRHRLQVHAQRPQDLQVKNSNADLFHCLC
jgi:hypothetical protein